MSVSHVTTNPVNTDGVSAVPGISNRALGLKLYSGEVIKQFDRTNIARSLVMWSSISGGKSKQFIVTGQDADTDSTTHTPGTDVVAKVMKVDERVISITDRIYFSHFVDDLDLKLSQYDIRGTLAKQAAEALSTKIDKEIFATMGWCADPGTNTSAAPVANQAAATIVDQVDAGNASSEAAGNALVGALFDANAEFNGKDVPMEGRVFVTTPVNYYKIVQSTRAVDKDYTNGNGGIDMGTVMKIAGTPIIWTNHLPATVTAGATPTTSTVDGYLIREGVMGVVSAMDVQSEANYIPEKLGSLLTSYYALGMGILNPSEFALITRTTVA